MPEQQNIRDIKLVQYLVEAHGKEQQLETALEAHIAMTTHKPYRRRLQQHLAETKRHAREVEKRIKQLGGTADGGGIGVDTAVEAVEAVQTLAKKGVALAQGPVHMLRGTGEAEKMLKNAKTEFASEAEEIAGYKAIETLADAVGDKDTAKLARTICREEEKMSNFLGRQIETLTKQVAREEIPAGARLNGSSGSRPRKRTTSSATRKSASASSRKKATGSGARKSASTTSARKRTTGAGARKRTTAASRSRASSSSSRSRARSTSARRKAATRS